MDTSLKEAKTKITVHVSKSLLKEAQEATGRSITETVADGLKKLARSKSYKELLKLKGSVKLDINIAKLREDKR